MKFPVRSLGFSWSFRRVIPSSFFLLIQPHRHNTNKKRTLLLLLLPFIWLTIIAARKSYDDDKDLKNSPPPSSSSSSSLPLEDERVSWDSFVCVFVCPPLNGVMKTRCVMCVCVCRVCAFRRKDVVDDDEYLFPFDAIFHPIHCGECGGCAR